ncbi:hypothetical protein LXL04_015591 [Taraxacum kok-saghyz]
MTTNEAVIDVDVEDQNDDGVETLDKMRSIVWQHFPYKKGAQTSKCNHCNKVLACGVRMGTSGLLNHLRNTCKTSGIYKEHTNDPNKQSNLNFKPKDTEDGGSLAKHSFSQENCRLKLAKMCIKDNRPFSVVDDEGFQDYSQELRPEFILPSRWTVARDCMLVFEQEVEKIKHLMKRQAVCLNDENFGKPKRREH